MRRLDILKYTLIISVFPMIPLVFSSHFYYPPVRRDNNAVDRRFGKKVLDPYKYLEDPNSQETLEFIQAQNELTDNYLKRGSVKAEIESKVKKIYDYPRYGVPVKQGDRYYWFKNTGLQDQDVVYVEKYLDSPEPDVFIDPNTLSDQGTNFLEGMQFTEDGHLVALAWKNTDSDWMTLRIRKAISGEYFHETLHDIKFSNVAWTKDKEGFFYARYSKHQENATNAKETGSQKLFYHRVGTHQRDDVMVVDFEDPELILGNFFITDDGKHLVIFPYYRSGEDMVYFAHISDPISENLELISIVSQPEDEYVYMTSKKFVIYLKTNQDAPNGRLIAVNLKNLSEWTTVIPEHPKQILDWARNIGNDRLVVKYLVDAKSTLEIRSMEDGSLTQQLDIPLGTVDEFSGKKGHKEFFFRVVSFFLPGIIYHVDFSRVLPYEPYEVKVFREVKLPGLDPEQFVAKQLFYKSKDDTQIPMFVLHKKDLQHRDRNAPALIFSYGGSSFSMLPSFQRERIIFLNDFHGVFAIPNIRGGGEYGRLWREGGQLLNAQNSLDDFQAAAEFLIQEGYTRPSKIAIVGRSNGGALVAACANQKPGLYRAVISQVGVHDVFHSHKFTIGDAGCAESGCSDLNGTILESKLKWSPLHNVRVPKGTNVQYPAMLLTTATGDDKVVPWHSYKLIAELQYKIGKLPRQTNPLLVRIDTSAGHGTVKPTSKIIKEVTEAYTFLVESGAFAFTPSETK